MTQRQLADAVQHLVEQSDWVTFIQIQKLLRTLKVPARGEINLSLHTDENVVLWSGMSEPMAEVVMALMRENRIFAHKASVAAYHVQGGVLNLPLADRPARGGLKQPHWLPVAFRAVPPGFALH